jgi:hypothetical protein
VALIVEVLDPRTGEVRLRRRLDAGPVTLGRAYDNDIVLDDPYADVRHARIVTDEAGALVLEDLGSVNALVAPGGGGARQTRVALRPDLEVRLGRTRLRFRDSDAPLPAALPDLLASAGGMRLPRWVGTWSGQLGVSVAATAALGWITWLGSFAASPGSQVANTTMGILLIAALWAGIWAVAGRIVVQKFRFLGHLAAVLTITLCGFVLVAADEWATFLFPNSAWKNFLAGVAGLVLIAALVAGHLALSSTMPRRRRWSVGLATSAVVLAIGAVFTLAEDQSFSDVPDFSATLKPFPARWLPTATMEEFGLVEDDLKTQVDALANDD